MKTAVQILLSFVTKLLSTPPVTVRFFKSKPLITSLNVKVMFTSLPEERLISLTLILSVGAMASTSCLAISEVLPFLLVAIASILSPCFYPGFSIDQFPLLSVVVIFFSPFGKVMVTIESGSAFPLMRSLALIGSNLGAAITGV